MSTEAELRRERIMARGTDRLKRLERARSELEPDAPPSYTASPSAPATPEKAAPLETAEHFPPSFPPSIPRTETPALRRAQREADALAGETEDDPPMGALPSFTLPSPSDVAHGPALPEGDPMELLQQMFQAGAGQAAQGPMTNPLLAALQSATKQKDPAEQTRLANVALAQKELLRRAKPFRIVGILFSVLLALFALYLLATSSNVVDLAGLDENGDMQNADYAGWKSGARRIARLRFGAKEVLEDLGSEAVGYPLYVLFLLSQTTLLALFSASSYLLNTSLDIRLPMSLREKIEVPMTIVLDDAAVCLVTIGLGVLVAGWIA